MKKTKKLKKELKEYGPALTSASIVESPTVPDKVAKAYGYGSLIY